MTPAPDALFWQLGAGAMFALYVLRLVLDFLHKWMEKKQGSTSGDKSPEWWAAKISEIVASSQDQRLVPALQRVETALNQMKDELGKFIAVEKARRRGRVGDD